MKLISIKPTDWIYQHSVKDLPPKNPHYWRNLLQVSTTFDVSIALDDVCDVINSPHSAITGDGYQAQVPQEDKVGRCFSNIFNSRPQVVWPGRRSLQELYSGSLLVCHWNDPTQIKLMVVIDSHRLPWCGVGEWFHFRLQFTVADNFRVTILMPGSFSRWFL